MRQYFYNQNSRLKTSRLGFSSGHKNSEPTRTHKWNFYWFYKENDLVLAFFCSKKIHRVMRCQTWWEPYSIPFTMMKFLKKISKFLFSKIVLYKIWSWQNFVPMRIFFLMSNFDLQIPWKFKILYNISSIC